MASDGANLRNDTAAGIRTRIAATSDERTDNRRLIASGKWREAEPDDTRISAFTARIDRKAGHAEAMRGTNDFQQAAFLPDGARARRAIARTVMDTVSESRTGTGFLISPSLFLTNQHVIRDRSDADLTQIVFDYELDENGAVRPTTTFTLAPGVLYEASDEAELDYALVAVGPRLNGTGVLTDFGYCPLSNTPDRHQLGINANIIQHPNGNRKIIVVRNNLVLARNDEMGRLYYETDTLEGSSGAPVFNDLWDVIALHHYGEAADDITLPDGTKSRSVNEGIRISSIYDDLSRRLPELTGAGRKLLEEALILWKAGVPTEKSLSSSPRSPGGAAATLAPRPSPEAFVNPKQEVPLATSVSEAKLVLPLEITVRIGHSGEASLPDLNTGRTTSQTSPILKSLAEAKRLDRNYSNRNGYNPGFIPDMPLDLRQVVHPVADRIVELSQSGEGDAPGELRYQNFSVIMNREHRVALLTATNIDGATYVAIDRASGEPAEKQPRPEGDTWYKDTRIDEIHTLTNDFYGEWSHIFDRGHLTRRNDPTWGENAERANVDTFHFTNCSPQHWKFNQSIKFWQGIERYVLEQGIWETGLDKPVTVLQGPLYDAPQPLFADDVQVPNAFWKILVWNGRGGKKAVALVADQTALLPIKRLPGGQPDERTRVDVTEFRSTVKYIADQSGLNLDAIAPFDTAAGQLPHAGEAKESLTNFAQFEIG